MTDDDERRPPGHQPEPREPVEPFASPSGDAPAWGQAPPPPPVAPGSPWAPPSGATPPAVPRAVPPAAPVPWGAPPPYPGPPAFPGYAALPGAEPPRTHGGAVTALVLGIIGCTSALLCFCTYGVAFLGTLVSPVAAYLGLSARREIDAQPGVFSNRGVAQGGFVTGLVGTVVGFLELVALVVLLVALARDPSSIS